MLNAIPPRWPRAFTAIGFGALAAYLLVIAFGLVPASRELSELLRSASEIEDATEKLNDEIEAANRLCCTNRLMAGLSLSLDR
ncbi:MAG: hypothetical protein V4551_00280, partial [Pseudomonadota bacterium]